MNRQIIDGIPVSIPPASGDDGAQWFAPPLDMWDHFDIAMVRNRPEFVECDEAGPRLHLGAGRKGIEDSDGEEWVDIDYPQWDAEDYGTESNRARLPYDDGEVAEIACYHTLDHLTPEAVVRALAEFQRVLMPNGVVTIIVPHFMGTLWNECLFHKSRFAVDTWRNIFSERQYDHAANDAGQFKWELSIGVNMIMGLNERNLILYTQLVRR